MLSRGPVSLIASRAVAACLGHKDGHENGERKRVGCLSGNPLRSPVATVIALPSVSRRFYSPLAPPESPPADLHLRRSRCDSGLPPSAMRPWAADSGAVRAQGRRRNGPRTRTGRTTDEVGTGHGRGRKNPRTGPVGAVSLTASTRIRALTCHFRRPARCRRHLRHRGLARHPGCRGLRRCAGWRRWPGRRCSGRRSTAGPRRRARRGGRPRWRAPRSSARATPPRAAGHRGVGRAVTCTGRG